MQNQEPFFGLGRTFVLGCLTLVIVATFGLMEKPLPDAFLEIAMTVLGFYSAKSVGHAFAGAKKESEKKSNNGTGVKAASVALLVVLSAALLVLPGAPAQAQEGEVDLTMGQVPIGVGVGAFMTENVPGALARRVDFGKQELLLGLDLDASVMYSERENAEFYFLRGYLAESWYLDYGFWLRIGGGIWYEMHEDTVAVGDETYTAYMFSPEWRRWNMAFGVSVESAIRSGPPDMWFVGGYVRRLF